MRTGVGVKAVAVVSTVLLLSCGSGGDPLGDSNTPSGAGSSVAGGGGPVGVGASQIDASFGQNGGTLTPFDVDADVANAVAIQTDGKILLAGQSLLAGQNVFALARYNAAGVLDGTFGGNGDGKVTTFIQDSDSDGTGDGDDLGRAMLIQPDGKIVVAGLAFDGPNAENAFGVARFNADGTLDQAVLTRFPAVGGADEDAGGWAVARQQDGKIVVAGTDNAGDFALVRYNPDLTEDLTFGSGGVVTTAIGSGVDQIRAMAIQTDGKIVVAGLTANGPAFDAVVARYNAGGTLDAAFGSGGVIQFAANGDQGARALALQSTGKMVVAAGGSLMRFNPNGTRDFSFGLTGSAASRDPVNAIAIVPQTDQIIAVGGDVSRNDADFVVEAYSANGLVNPLFGAGGVVITPIGIADDEAKAVAIQSDRKIVVVGSVETSDDDKRFAVVRYVPAP